MISISKYTHFRRFLYTIIFSCHFSCRASLICSPKHCAAITMINIPPKIAYPVAEKHTTLATWITLISHNWINFKEFSKRFEWSEELQGIILGSLYIGYVIFQIPGGLLAGRIGGKPIIVTALSFTCFLTLCTPFLVTAGGANALIVVRVIIGGLQGASFVSILTITSLWVPTRERGRLGALVFCGIPVFFKNHTCFQMFHLILFLKHFQIAQFIFSVRYNHF